MYFAGSGAIAEVTAVSTPEPSTLVLLSTASMALMKKRRKKKSEEG
jgi:hypothetical protein